MCCNSAGSNWWTNAMSYQAANRYTKPITILLTTHQAFYSGTAAVRELWLNTIQDFTSNIYITHTLQLIATHITHLHQDISKYTVSQTSGSAMAEGLRDALVSRNSATTKHPI